MLKPHVIAVGQSNRMYKLNLYFMVLKYWIVIMYKSNEIHLVICHVFWFLLIATPFLNCQQCYLFGIWSLLCVLYVRVKGLYYCWGLTGGKKDHCHVKLLVFSFISWSLISYIRFNKKTRKWAISTWLSHTILSKLNMTTRNLDDKNSSLNMPKATAEAYHEYTIENASFPRKLPPLSLSRTQVEFIN